ERVKGRIVFFNHDMKEAEDYGRFAGLRGMGPSAASKAGAVGALVRSLATASLSTPHTGMTRFEDGVTPLPAASVTVEGAERLLARQKPAPRRTVRVVLFMNEENGLRGGKAYAEAHAAELPHHVAAIEMDAGGGRPLGVALRAGEGAPALVQPWLSPLVALGA